MVGYGPRLCGWKFQEREVLSESSSDENEEEAVEEDEVERGARMAANLTAMHKDMTEAVKVAVPMTFRSAAEQKE